MDWCDAYMELPGWITALATAGLALTGWRALTTWKAQSKAQLQTEFLDQITDAVHEFLGAIPPAIQMVGIIKIEIESYTLPGRTPHQGAVAYIEENGNRDAKMLMDYLKPCSQMIFKVRSLLAKGQVFGFNDYGNCRQACDVILWQHDRIQALYAIIGHLGYNWDNPKVQETLAKVTKIDSEEMKQKLNEAHVIFLSFVKDNYAAILT